MNECLTNYMKLLLFGYIFLSTELGMSLESDKIQRVLWSSDGEATLELLA